MFGSLFPGVTDGVFAGLAAAVAAPTPPPNNQSDPLPLLFGDETA